MTAPSLTTTSLPIVEPVSAARFVVSCLGWTTGIGFSELAGFSSSVEPQEYSYAGRLGNVRTKQFGRATPPSLTLRRALDSVGFAQLFAWHTMARMNNPLGKTTAQFMMLSAAGLPVATYVLDNAWCARLDIEQAQAGTSLVMMKTTIECDSISMM
jgi:phage tail-like protein